MLPFVVQFLHFILKPAGLLSHQGVDLLEKILESTHTFGLLIESFPKEVSGGRIVVSSHVRLKPALAFQLLGVDDGAAGYATEDVAATDDVAAACRVSNLLC